MDTHCVRGQQLLPSPPLALNVHVGSSLPSLVSPSPLGAIYGTNKLPGPVLGRHHYISFGVLASKYNVSVVLNKQTQETTLSSWVCRGCCAVERTMRRYLNDGYEGGRTLFPNASTDGVAAVPKKYFFSGMPVCDLSRLFWGGRV